MVKVNLLPREDLEKKAIGKFLKWTLSYGRYIIICVELVVFCVFFSRFIYDQRLADINERVEQKQAIVASAADFETRIRNIQKNIEQVRVLDSGRTIYIAVLSRLKEIIPKEMVFNSLEFAENEMFISGTTLTNESFARFITDLKASNIIFSEISIDSVGKIGDDNGGSSTAGPEMVVFEIKAQIEGYQRYEPSPTAAPESATSAETEGF